MVISDDMAIIDDRLAYAKKELADKAAEDIGCEGYHEHEYEGKTWYMPCEKHKLAKIGPRGGVKKSPKAPGSKTPNPKPKGKGSAKGDASGKRGAKVSQKDRIQRGLGAFNTSHSPRIRSASQWAHARVNAFMYLVKNGRPQNKKYTTDYDLLPKKHPKSSKK
jgi:hypothetical protein